jgi:glycerol-3-phosphate O-acyltransferase
LKRVLSFAAGLLLALLLAGRLWRRRTAQLATDPALEELAREHAAEEGLDFEWVLRRARRYAVEISPSPGAPLYRLLGLPLAALVCRSLYDVRRSGAVPELTADVTTIFVMNHRSNMDYVILSHLTADRQVVSYAAGEWARYGILGDFVRANGSFFVRRGSGERLYRRVLQLFVRSAVEGGMTMAVFPEGGLTRDGRPREPRIGLLDYMLRHFDVEGGRDRVFVPVSVNYDWTLEDLSLVHGEDPRELPPVRLFATTALSVATNVALALSVPRRLGRASVHFGRPISVRDYARSRNTAFDAPDRERRGEVLRAFAGHLMNTIAAAIPLVPSSAVACVLVSAPEEGLSEGEIRSRADALVEAYGERGAPVAPGFCARDGLDLLILRGLVEGSGHRYRAVPGAEKLLRYYAASVSYPPA